MNWDWWLPFAAGAAIGAPMGVCVGVLVMCLMQINHEEVRND